MLSHKKWVVLVVILMSIMLISISTINYVVDPYGIYFDEGQSYNSKKLKNRDTYLFKVYQLNRSKPEAIVLGTSRSMRLNPSLIESITGKKAYNLGLYGSSPYIQYKYLEYALKVSPNLKSVIIGLDYHVFNKSANLHANYVEQRLSSPFYLKDYFSTLLSKQALIGSYNVLVDNLNGTDYYTSTEMLGDGTFDERYIFPDTENQLTLRRSRLDYQLSDHAFDYIAKIKELCEKHNIKLYMYTSPLHAIVLETHWQMDEWKNYEEWLRQLVIISPVWDFSGFHDISMSSLIHDDYYNDLSHFSKKVGNYILYRMLDTNLEEVPSYFGVQVTQSNIDEHITQLRLSREQWSERDKNMPDIADRY